MGEGIHVLASRDWKSTMPYNDAASTGESLWLPYQAGVEPVMYRWYVRQLTKEANEPQVVRQLHSTNAGGNAVRGKTAT